MARSGRLLAALVGLAATLQGCGAPRLGPGPAMPAGIGAKAGAPAAWTLLVYQAAAGDLEEFAPLNLNEMEAGLGSDRINVVVFFDGMKPGSAKLFEVVRDPGGMNKVVVSRRIADGGAVIPPSGDLDSGDPATLTRFATWGIQKYPARRYGLVIWNHGSGLFDDAQARNRRRDANPGQNEFGLMPDGFAWSDKTGKHMNTRDVPGILQAAGRAAGGPIDLLGFDACLMSHLEMAYQAKGLARTMVASEEIEPGYGWDYRLWLKQLSARPDADGNAVGAMAVKAYQETFSPGGSHYRPDEDNNTLTATDIVVANTALVPAVNGLADALLAALPGNKRALQRVRAASRSFDNKDCVDLGSFCQRLRASDLPETVKVAATRVETALGGTVVALAKAGPKIQDATGLVVYFPRSKKSYRDEYDDPGRIAFASERWRAFLRAYVKLD
ncbi:MAG: hypothetical protein FJZ01_20200 [Candidatus Sericytochromatia bacterium]|nr:hypothetical protein [Candidatus Tanganyikabacteria bacterium]